MMPEESNGKADVFGKNVGPACGYSENPMPIGEPDTLTLEPESGYGERSEIPATHSSDTGGDSRSVCGETRLYGIECSKGMHLDKVLRFCKEKEGMSRKGDSERKLHQSVLICSLADHKIHLQERRKREDMKKKTAVSLPVVFPLLLPYHASAFGA